jgi:hypothetical protein
MHTIEKAAQIAAIALAACPDGKPRQMITDENIRQIGAAFGVELNEDVLNYHDENDIF